MVITCSEIKPLSTLRLWVDAIHALYIEGLGEFGGRLEAI